MNFYQVCFTRLSAGEGEKTGWQLVNVSPELPQAAAEFFNTVQTKNISAPGFDAEDADRQITTELYTNGDYAYKAQVRSNVGVDESGRAIMFAQAFVFPLEDFIRSPQEVLTVSDKNYHFDVAQTVNLPAVLNRRPEIPLASAVASLGLTVESYTSLVQSVYFMLTGKTQNTLHIICDCRPETIQAAMIAIYAALPLEFRKRVSFATYEFPNGTSKTIIFDRQVKNASHQLFNLATGENNVLTDIIRKRWEKYQFTRFVPEHYQSAAEVEDYFSQLDEQLTKLGGTQTLSLDLYKLADELPVSDFEAPEELSIKLNELLSAPISSPYLDEQIRYLLSQVIEKQILLNDIISEKLSHKLETTQDQDLIESGYSYTFVKMSQMSVEEAAKYIFNAYTNRQSAAFLQIKQRLNASEEGQEILNSLYIDLVYGDKSLSKEQLIAFHEETKDFVNRSKVEEALAEKSLDCLQNLLDTEKEPDQLMTEVHDFLGQILSNRADIVSMLEAGVKEDYWKSFSVAGLQLEELDKYKVVYSGKSELCRTIFELGDIFQLFVERDLPEFEHQINEFFSDIYGDQSIYVQKLQEACLAHRELCSPAEIDVWLSLASLSKDKKNPAAFLIENQIISDLDTFAAAFEQSSYLQRNSATFSRYLEEYKQESKLAGEILKFMKTQKKELQKEQDRQVKEAKHTLKRSRETDEFDEDEDNEEEEEKLPSLRRAEKKAGEFLGKILGR